MCMRVVSWNCNGALRNKAHLLEPLKADVWVIQECEPLAKLGLAMEAWGANALRVGDPAKRGLAVFAKPSISLRALDLEPDGLELFLPVQVNNIMLLAVWTKQANSPTFAYIGQLYKWLQKHKSYLAEQDPVMVVGDFNSNTCWDLWDRWWNHSDVVRDLEALGLKSLYHHQFREAQGEETRPTFFMHRNLSKPYHIDYAFLSASLLAHATLQLGDRDPWLKWSDHLPLVIDF